MRRILFNKHKFTISDICKRINIIYTHVDLDIIDMRDCLTVKTHLKINIRRKFLSYTKKSIQTP